MGLRSWIRQRLNGDLHRIDLVAPGPVEIPPPARAGLQLDPVAAPWSVARLTDLLREAEHQPTVTPLQAARLARHRLSRFWLDAPVDQLEALYAGELGTLQRSLLQGSLVQQDLAGDEQRWRDQLARGIAQPGEQVRQINWVLALMPYTRPGALKVSQPLQALPDWLLGDYVAYCAPELEEQLNQPAGLLKAGADAPEPLTQRRGEQAMAWFRDAEVLARMRALIRQYKQMPLDQETLEELCGLRRVVAQLWLDVEVAQLQTLHQTAVGAITRALLLAGFGDELLDATDERARRELLPLARDLSQPRAAGYLLALLLFVPLESVTVESADQLPDWLTRDLREIAAQLAAEQVDR